MWSGLASELLVSHLRVEARGLTRVSDGTPNKYCPSLRSACPFARAGRTLSPRRKSHKDRMHQIDQQTLIRQRREDGSETPY